MKKYIKIPKNYFEPLKFRINWDWNLFFQVKRLAILESLLKEIKKGRRKLTSISR